MINDLRERLMKKRRHIRKCRPLIILMKNFKSVHSKRKHKSKLYIYNLFILLYYVTDNIHVSGCLKCNLKIKFNNYKEYSKLELTNL